MSALSVPVNRPPRSADAHRGYRALYPSIWPRISCSVKDRKEEEKDLRKTYGSGSSRTRSNTAGHGAFHLMIALDKLQHQSQNGEGGKKFAVGSKLMAQARLERAVSAEVQPRLSLRNVDAHRGLLSLGPLYLPFHKLPVVTRKQNKMKLQPAMARARARVERAESISALSAHKMLQCRGQDLNEKKEHAKEWLGLESNELSLQKFKIDFDNMGPPRATEPCTLLFDLE
ncbi:hypothetical protein DFH08DRAFT_800067 [Mycena albidolilacea]|uniref:Uncharacterized protein n=1 Tax=Mycena albidolilacea TaxID=1033008 RepID=A0AAD7F3L5_9AGAR|nr:hypothetical protein DFH08DRAFT_800067 [Mycena albidolilacea]